MIGTGAGAVGGWGTGLRGWGWHILLFAIVLGGTSSAQLTKRVSKSSSEVPGNDDSNAGGGDRCVSADGRFVVFSSRATDLVPGDTNGAWDVFVHDRQTGTTERVSVATGGAQADYDSSGASISADGRFIAFVSGADDLVAGDTNALGDIFVRDRQLATTERVTVATGGAQANDEGYDPSISADGWYVAFSSGATNLVANVTNGNDDGFVRDRRSGATELMSVATNGSSGTSGSFDSSISSDGRFVVFDSHANNLISSDTNQSTDVFVRDRIATGFASLCDPGMDGVRACPCSNPPNGSGRGCDNSASTGGAVLSASGVGYLSIDSLVFTTSGERPTALSIVMQGDVFLMDGVVYGQGVRCAGGATKRLFVKSAVSGSITAPDLGAGDPSVSARSAANGDVIQSGQSRWYVVYYRDPNVVGSCPASSTFNATQTGRVEWSL